MELAIEKSICEGCGFVQKILILEDDRLRGIAKERVEKRVNSGLGRKERIEWCVSCKRERIRVEMG